MKTKKVLHDLNHLTFKPKNSEGGSIQSSSLRFLQKCVFQKKLKPWLFVTFSIILSHNFAENLIKIPQLVSEDMKFLFLRY